jgi:hypothetical protein
MIQLHVECLTELDAKTVLLGCLARYEGVMLRLEDVQVTEEAEVKATETVTVFYEEAGRSYGLELELQHYPAVPTRQPSSWPAPDDLPLEPDIVAATLIEIDERPPTPEDVREFGLEWVTDASRLAKILEEVR